MPQVFYNLETKAFYFQSENHLYRFDLNGLKKNPDHGPIYESIDEFENQIIYLSEGGIEIKEQKFRVVKSTYTKLTFEYNDLLGSCEVNYDIKENLITFAGNIDFVYNLNKLIFSNIKIISMEGSDLNLAIMDINEINSIGLELYKRLNENYKHFKIAIELDQVRFHLPTANTIESF